MIKKLGEEAFAFYAGLGTGRTFNAVAEHLDVTRRAVTRAAKQGKWAERVQEIDNQARQKLNQVAAETLEEMNARHLKVAKYIQSKALDALKSLPLDSAFAAVRALKIAMEAERLVRGEPTDHHLVSTEEIIRREYSRWLGKGPGEADDEDALDDDEAEACEGNQEEGDGEEDAAASQTDAREGSAAS